MSPIIMVVGAGMTVGTSVSEKIPPQASDGRDFLFQERLPLMVCIWRPSCRTNCIKTKDSRVAGLS
jgi:hypothetical protein